jgi:hypothetical protein
MTSGNVQDEILLMLTGKVEVQRLDRPYSVEQ